MCLSVCQTCRQSGDSDCELDEGIGAVYYGIASGQLWSLFRSLTFSELCMSVNSPR